MKIDSNQNQGAKSAMAGQHDTDLLQAVTDEFTSDEIEGFLGTIAPDCEEVKSATGETFSYKQRISFYQRRGQ
jgi:hypothetical protein